MYKGLGYTGFSITARNALGQLAFKTVGRGKSTSLESLLVSSFPGKMSQSLHEHVMGSINENVVSTLIVRSSTCKRILIHWMNSPYLNL